MADNHYMSKHIHETVNEKAARIVRDGQPYKSGNGLVGYQLESYTLMMSDDEVIYLYWDGSPVSKIENPSADLLAPLRRLQQMFGNS